MSSNPSSPSPSHRNPLTLLSKLKRQLSKSPVTHQQPVEHQYLPIPTVSLSESVRSPPSTTYSCSNHSSSGSSFVFIDHNEEPVAGAVEQYKPFLPLIIQHERLQQRLAAVIAPPPPPPPSPPSPPCLVPAQPRRARIPPPNSPPSPTSTASSTSPVTPNFTSSFFGTSDDDIMTLGSSEVGSISEYSLPRSLSAYLAESRSTLRVRKSTCSISDAESRRGRVRGLSVQTPPSYARRYPSYKSFPPAPISPPPSCPLPETPLYVRPLAMSDGEAPSSSRLFAALNTGRARSVGTSPAPPSPSITVPASGLSPAICLVTKKRSSTSILSELDIPTPASVYNESTISANEPHYQNHDIFSPPTSPPSTHISLSPPTTPKPKQYGIGRQVLRGSGSDFGCNFTDSTMGSISKRSSKRSSKRMSVKRESSVIESRSLVPEDSKSPDGDGETPFVPVETDEALASPTPIPTQPTPNPRRRVKSDDTNPSVKTHSRRTTHYEKPVGNPEWTLFLGIPRNAPPPVPKLVPKPESTAAPTTRGKIQNQRHTLLLPTHLPPSPMRNRTKSDSALLAGNTEPDGNVKPKTKTKRGETGEDWTLSLPLAASPTSPSAGSKYFASVSGSGTQAGVAEECARGVVDVDAETGLVITVEDVDRRQMQQQEDQKRDNDEEEEDQDQDSESLIFHVPRIVRSCSSSPPPSTSVNNVHGRRRKSSMKWIGASSTPDLVRSVERFSSSTLEEEVMRMLLGDDDDGDNNAGYDSESSTKSVEDLMMLAQKKMATLDEDLARFNALLRSGDGSRLTSKMIEAMAMRTVTLHSHPTPTRPTTPLKKSKSIVGTLKPVLKHAKSCEPTLESFHSNGGHCFPPLPPPPPVLRFPSSTARGGDLNFFDKLVGGDVVGLENKRASLRLTKSAEWVLGTESNTLSTTLPMLSALPRGSSPSSSPRTAWSSTCSISTTTTTSTQTLLLPFAHSKYAPPSSPLKSKGMVGGSRKGGESRVSSIRAVSLRSTTTPAAPVEPLGTTKSQKEKHPQPEQPPSQPHNQHHHHHRKRCPPSPLSRLHTADDDSFSSSSSSTFHFQRRHTRRPVSPPRPPSPIPSESSSTLITPLASAFPLPPSSLGISGSSGFVQKLREFESATRDRQQQEQEEQRRQRRYQSYKPPSTGSSVSSVVSNASSTATVMPCRDQKMKMRGPVGVRAAVAGASSGSGSGGVMAMEDDEDSLCSGPYYSARSSFSNEQS